jgi:hypothetical protein
MVGVIPDHALNYGTGALNLWPEGNVGRQHVTLTVPFMAGDNHHIWHGF